uniref:Retrovirus-related Pol polyprotein from transposon TNT 1-94 n=1 Tax=Cajanus cajan TaxID=3821 RepID=A0A151R984_CAJCA|nr:hypothetical protein KK1_039613 [Cajanus cajan]
MEVPPGYGKSVENSGCRLKKALCRLKQPSQAWFGRFIKVNNLVYKQSNGDHILFIKHSTSDNVVGTCS